MITLDEARNIKEQLSPAFAGYVTDGNISDRDVLATLMDLIVRGKIGIDADTQATPVKVHRVYCFGNSSALLPFEKEFIKKLFEDSKELTPEKVREKILSQGLHSLISDNINALKEAKIVKSLLLKVDKEGRAKAMKFGCNDIKTIEDLEKRQKEVKRDSPKLLLGSLAFLLLIMFFLNWMSTPAYTKRLNFENRGNSAEITSLVMYAIMAVIYLFLLISGIVDLIQWRRANKLLVFQFENNVVPFVKHKYEELFEFIRKYPLGEQRLYNEFMPYAIAFGLDTSWNESFGIKEEIVVKSRVSGDI